MSWYTAGEILLWLLLAAVVGFILGWLIRRWRASRQRAEWEETRAKLEADLDECRRRRAAASAADAGASDLPEVDPVLREQVLGIAARTAGEGEVPKDDLRDVHGIGEVISKMLYSMNITSFRQVARFTAEDIATVSAALKVFPDRVTRDDWMSSARSLHKEKYGYDA